MNNNFSTPYRLLLGVLVFAMAGSIHIAAQDYVFRHLTTRSGIAGGYINEIVQDDLGFIWIATSSGLSRFDGMNFVNYRHQTGNNASLSSSEVNRLIDLGEHQMLVANAAGVDLFDKSANTFRPLKIPDEMAAINSVRDMIIDDEGDLWVASENRLYYFQNPDFKADVFQPEIFTIPTDDESFVIRTIEWFNNELWVGSSSGIYVFNSFSNAFRQVVPNNPELMAYSESEAWEIITAPDGHLYISMLNGLLRWNTDTNQLERITELAGLSEQNIRESGFQDMMIDSDNNLWIGSSAFGAIKWDLFDNEFEMFIPDPEDINTVNSGDVHYLFEDNQENIWFGYHFLGISLMYDQTWNYQTDVPFPEAELGSPLNYVRTAFMDERSTLWGVTPRGLLRDLGSPNVELIPVDVEKLGIEDDFNSIFSFQAMHEGVFYFTAFGPSQYMDYLIAFDRNNPEDPYRILRTPEETGILDQSMVSGDKAYLSSYRSSHLLIFDLNTEEFELVDTPYEGEHSDALFTAVTPDAVRDGIIYLGFYAIVTPDGDHLIPMTYDVETGEIREQDFSIDVDIIGINAPLRSSYQPGTVYLNSANGLIQINRFDNTINVLFEDRIALLREGDLRMTEDQEGYIWLNNQTGLIRVDPITESLEYFEVPRERYVDAPSSGVTLRNGEIIFGGTSSYLRFNPANLRGSEVNGDVLITSMLAGDQTYQTTYSDPQPEIDSDQNTLTFNFIGMNFREPTSVHYRYRIIGSENDQWVDVGSQRSVFIPNLNTGDYTFEVQSGSQFGTFNEQTAIINFSILPPWWNTIPAYFLYALILAGVLFGIDRLQRRRLILKERERAREKELEQAKEIEKAYDNLKAAQEQLVQQEKLASLGQLTAGIAHEIKNPLNFVNNFSDLSVELLNEYREEFENKYGTEPQQELDDILNDIEVNLKKIHEHGARADSIVKSMLQHSRGGSGEKADTDLNALLKEYTNLSFHGMRAGKDPINVDIDLQLDDSVGQIPLVAEDFSRVVVNLCNNAFDAMRTKLNSGDNTADSGEYKPVLKVRTSKENGKVFIEIGDNGPGIPEKFRDKVLQPFFTTKEGTEGTGLGLSITNDIIQAHGGSIQIDSKEGKGAVFTIVL